MQSHKRAKQVIDLIQDSHYDGFCIIMVISHVVCQGENIGRKTIVGKSAYPNIQIKNYMLQNYIFK